MMVTFSPKFTPVRLIEYLVGQILQRPRRQFVILRRFFPREVKKDWNEDVADQHVVTMKPQESKVRFKPG